MALEPYDLPDPRAYEAAQNEGFEPEIVDVPLDDVIDKQDTPPELNIDRATPRELLNAVIKRGSYMFNKGQGRMLIKCPAYSTPAVCPLHPLPDPVSGKPTMVCTGPNVAKETKHRLFGENTVHYTVKPCRRGCPYNPEKLNEFRREFGDSRHHSEDELWL